MKRKKLKLELAKLYTGKDMVNSILLGRRRPSYENILSLNDSCKIPFKAWVDIKTYLRSGNTKEIK